MPKLIIDFEEIKKMNDLTPQNFILYHVIKNSINSSGDCQLTMKELSEITNIAYNNINRNLNQLVKLKYIKIKKEPTNLNKKIISPLK